MPAGRPTDYGDWAVEKAEEYIKYCRENKEIPYIEELADEWLDCDEDTIANWSVHKEFFGAIKRIKMRQKMMLMKGEGAMKIFQLKANHGMIETEKRIEQHTIKFEELDDDQLNASIRQKAAEVGIVSTN